MNINKWVDVPGYTGLYRVSDAGVVVSTYWTTDKEIGQWENGNGYMYLTLNRGGKQKQFAMHRLVLSAFDRIPSRFEEANHKNGDKSDNRIGNLEWVTGAENMKHAVNTGLSKRSGTLNQGKYHHWVHEDGEEFDGTAMMLSRKHPNLKWGSLYEVSSGRKQKCYGWAVEELQR